MSELTLTLMRLGLLVMLWLFVFAVVGVLRTDLFGTRVSRRTRRRAAHHGAVPVSGPPAPGYAAPALPPSGAPAARPAPPAQPSGRGGAGARGIPTSVAVTEGRLAGTVIPLTPAGILVGRNPECSLVLDDDFASGRHLRLFLREGSWWEAMQTWLHDRSGKPVAPPAIDPANVLCDAPGEYVMVRYVD